MDRRNEGAVLAGFSREAEAVQGEADGNRQGVWRCRQQDVPGCGARLDVHRCCLRGDSVAVTGPLFGYSDTWQLVINTGTTIVTFLMVFLIQNSQNRDSAAIQVKLDELIRVSAARNSFVGIEHLTDDELEEIRTKCETRAQAEKNGRVSVERTGEKARRAADRVVGS